jgi:branched-chain amino acid transport system substrate-binding protein
VIALSRFGRSRALLTAVLLVSWLAACSIGPADDKTYTLVTVFPASGVDAPIGQMLQRAVDLAVKQNAALGNGYTLAVTHLDEATGSVGQDVSSALGNGHVMGIVGPFDSQSAAALLPVVEQSGVVTISPSTTLPGLTQSDQASAEGLTFTQLHPTGKPVAFFRLPHSDDAIGSAAADLAVAPTQSHGFGAGSTFVVDDGAPSGKSIAAAFVQELKAKHGTVAGQKSLQAGVPDSAQSAVTAIIRAAPDLVFFAGDVPAGAELRGTLTLSGAPGLVILTAGPAAATPNWATAVGLPAAATNTTAILPAQDLSALPNAKRFVSDYQAAYPGQDLLPQGALAYDAAMDEIAAIKSLVSANKTVTRAGVLSLVASSKYAGVTGTLAFDKKGDNTAPSGLAVYACDGKGVWNYQTSLTVP